MEVCYEEYVFFCFIVEEKKRKIKHNKQQQKDFL